MGACCDNCTDSRGDRHEQKEKKKTMVLGPSRTGKTALINHLKLCLFDTDPKKGSIHAIRSFIRITIEENLKQHKNDSYSASPLVIDDSLFSTEKAWQCAVDLIEKMDFNPTFDSTDDVVNAMQTLWNDEKFQHELLTNNNLKV